MDTTATVAAIIGFVVVAGFAVLAWYVRGRDPVIRDDASVILPAPPPEMTAATATIVDGGPSRAAFMAALLDLASRDEIRFHSEGRTSAADLVGIEIRGGTSTDPRVLANRRSPIGEGEAWLLLRLRESTAMAQLRGMMQGEVPTPESMGAAAEVMQAAMSFATVGALAPTGDSEAARSRREQGLFTSPVDTAELMRMYQARTGQPLSDHAQQAIAGLGASGLATYSDPMSVARDPDGFISTLASVTGRQLSPAEASGLHAWATRMTASPPMSTAYAQGASGTDSPSVAAQPVAAIPAAAPPPPAEGPPHPAEAPPPPAEAPPPPAAAPPTTPTTYIPASDAFQVGSPVLFGTMLQRYATRHGWFSQIPTLEKLRWRAMAGVEMVVAVVAALIGRAISSPELVGLAVGAFGGGIVTWFIAPEMPARTRQGALMRAQINAYERTLKATLDQATTIGDATGSSGLPWLDTPDRVIVWSVALGLQRDVEALLARDRSSAGPASPGSAPAWYVGQVSDAASMFAGIEAIGSGAIRAGIRPVPA